MLASEEAVRTDMDFLLWLDCGCLWPLGVCSSLDQFS